MQQLMRLNLTLILFFFVSLGASSAFAGEALTADQPAEYQDSSVQQHPGVSPGTTAAVGVLGIGLGVAGAGAALHLIDRESSNIAFGMYGAGGFFALTAIYIFAHSLAGHPQESRSAHGAVPYISPTANGLMVGGTF